MFTSRYFLFAFTAAVVTVALAAEPVAAQPPVHSVPAVRPLPPMTRPSYYRSPGSFYRYGVPSYSYGSGLYGPLTYGLGYSPFGYSGLTPGGVGYGPLGYGYPGLTVGVPVVPGTYYPRTYRVVPSVVEPLPAPAVVVGEAATATITVLTKEGTKISFDGAKSESVDGRYTFTTPPIPPGVEKRVSIEVNSPDGMSVISIGVRAGEKAKLDLRK